MKKFFKKGMALVVVLTFLLSVCSFTVFAEGIDTLTLEDITNGQSANLITNSLNLSTDYNWSVDSDGVVDLTTGNVTRALSEDKAVVLTAEDTVGNKESFSLVVKSQLYSVKVNEDYNTSIGSWKSSNYVSQNSEDDGNGYVKFDFTGADNPGAQVRGFSYSDDAIVTVSFDFKWDYIASTDEQTTYPYFDIYFNNGTNARSIQIKEDYLKIGNSGTEITNNTYDKNVWENITMEIDQVNSKVRVLCKNGEWTPWYGMLADGNSNIGTYFKDIRIQRGYGKGIAGTLYVDNFAVYTNSVKNIQAEEGQKEYIKSELSIDDLTEESAGALTENLTLDTFEGLVSWKSENSAIQNDGAVTRPDSAIFTSGAVSAYFKEEATPLVSFNFSVAPAGTAKINATKTLTEDFENYNIVNGFGKVLSSDAIGQNNLEEFTSSSHYLAYVITKAEDVVDGAISIVDAEERGGKAAKLSADSEKVLSVGIMPGGYLNMNSPKRFAVGFDFKYTPAEENGGTFTYALRGNDDTTSLEFDYANGVIIVYSGGNDVSYSIPDGVNSGEWTRVDIDINAAGASQVVYINGVALTEPINMGNSHKTNNYYNQLVRSMLFKLSSGGEVMVDNVAITMHTNDNAVYADGGAKRAYIDYNGAELASTMLLKTECTDIMTSWTDANKEAYGEIWNLSWSGNGVSENVFTTDVIGNTILTVTATGGSGDDAVTSSIDVKVKTAPVVLRRVDGKVIAEGATEGGVLIAAQYADSAKTQFVGAKVYTNTEDFAGTEIESGYYKFFFIDGLGSLKPLALMK